MVLLSGSAVGVSDESPGSTVGYIRVPQGLKVTVYASAVEGARSMTVGDDGTLFVGTRDTGRVYAIRDENGDGVADKTRVLVENLVFPNGVAVIRGNLYIADMTGIRRVPASQLKSPDPVRPETVFEGFPGKKHHGWKYMKAGSDGNLYLAVGVPCNICRPEGPYEGRLIRIDPNHPSPVVLAEGLRNSVGLEFGSGPNDIWLTDNGRDWLGDDLPPDELNHWTGSPSHFGYPACHGKGVKDPEYGEEGGCFSKTPPAWEFKAHVAALTPHFYRGRMLPDSYQGQMLVIQHGSWNRSVPDGYRIALLRFSEGKPVAEEVFADGWLNSEGKVLGRPADLLELPDGSLLVSDDYADRIYRISTATSSN